MRSLSFILALSFIANFSFAQSPHGESLKYDCSYCHQPTSWKILPDQMEFDHNETGFELVGQHQMVDCSSCHESLVFENAETDCFSCHTDIHNNTVGQDCRVCHSPVSWIVEDINEIHRESRFPLLGPHQSADCIQCHEDFNALNFEPLGVNCIDCHSQEYYSTTAPNHSEAGFSTECQDCHSLNRFEWSAGNFEHDFFPLVGGHNIQDCFSCHQIGSDFTGLTQDCYSCHQEDFESVQDPNHVANNFPTDCTQCHTIMGFSPATFDHNQTAFPLTGSHQTVNCSSCHESGFAGTPTECFSCHEDDYNGAENHLSENYPTDCTQCHNTNNWEDSDFDHNNTAFPLTGSHQAVDCSSCHQSGFAGTSTECFSCHEENYNQAPNHLSENFPTDCTQCHDTGNWENANFDHNNTAFPLTGAHTTVDCSNCHESGFAGTPLECFACHETNFNTTTNPDHTALSLSTNCEDCHSTNPGWEPAQFPVHDQFFELLGAHSAISNDCNSCHQGDFVNTPNTCFGCHEEEYNNTTDPNHQAAGFPTDCESCHSETIWEDATFDHDGQYFPIYTGSHSGEWNDCSECHTDPGNFTIFSCITCHEHNEADMNDEHEGVQGYIYDSQECFACHPTGEADDNSFNHQFSNFPLTGAHLTTDCQLCHQSGYQGTTTECFDCHNQDFTGTTNPDHQSLGFSNDCTACHPTDEGWLLTNFPIHDQFYELIGGHANIANDCETCHNNDYNNTPAQCFGCHEDQYNNAPEHLSQNYPTECEMCHTPVDWNETSFDHNNTNFPLTGAHVSVNCSDCHESGFSGTAAECFACHEDAFNNAQNPNHTAAGIPTTCEDCHSTTAWIPSTFDHGSTGFELIGVHATIQCSDCHEGTITGLNQACFDCHEEEYNSAPDHVEQGYPTNCELCHTAVGWNQTSFDHNNTNFPLTGAHTSVDCSDCHESGFSGTPTECFACHEDNYNNTTNPDHVALSLPTECEDCHTTEPGWSPASFPIHNQFYELIGAHADISNDCNTCHNGDYNNTPNTCFGCHEDDYNNTTDPPHASQNFPTDCLECHNQNAWEPATFNHDFYPISGDHNDVSCGECHSEPNFQPQCLSCHQDDFLEEHEPGDPTNCWDCHNTFDWDDDSNNLKLKIRR